MSVRLAAASGLACGCFTRQTPRGLRPDRPSTRPTSACSKFFILGGDRRFGTDRIEIDGQRGRSDGEARRASRDTYGIGKSAA